MKYFLQNFQIHSCNFTFVEYSALLELISGMASPIICASEILEDISYFKVSQTILIALVAILFLVILQYLLWRRRFSHLVPGKPPRFFDLLGNLSEMSFREKSRNGYSVNVFLLQFFGGFSKLFQKQKMFCVWFFCEPVIVLAKAEAVEPNINVESFFCLKKTLGKKGYYDEGGDEKDGITKILRRN
ncbi:cytochrome P450 4V2 [Trichonephila clavata]|uniref:Cytochrome P450 4V2 n=1 Tax=Trichonephila clavata TaxID=2740835 RepID=A0A8X6IKE4_TRICU|nr:cytochrome P450 4V2 [Trichonephila clavata]